VPGLNLHTYVGTGSPLNARQARIAYEYFVDRTRKAKEFAQIQNFIHSERRRNLDHATFELQFGLLKNLSRDQFEVIDAHANEMEAVLKIRVVGSKRSETLTRFVHMCKETHTWKYLEHRDYLNYQLRRESARKFLSRVRRSEPRVATRYENLKPFRLGPHTMNKQRQIHFDSQELYLWAHRFVDAGPGRKPIRLQSKIRLFDKRRQLIDVAQSKCTDLPQSSMSFSRANAKLGNIKYFSVMTRSCR